MGEGEVKEITRAETTSSKTKQCRDTQATIATISSLATKIGGTLTADSSRVYSNGRI